jgi:2-methylcitrate dehydratase PrpD
VEVDLAKGEPENPASWAELDKKFYNNARTLLSEEEAKRVSRTVMDLDHASLSQLVSLV